MVGLVNWLVIGFHGRQRVSQFYHQPNLTQALERCHFQFDDTYFPKVRRMLLFDAPLIFNTFGQLPRCFAGTLLLPLCLDQSSKFGALGLRWGYADEVHLGKSIRAKDFGLEF